MNKILIKLFFLLFCFSPLASTFLNAQSTSVEVIHKNQYSQNHILRLYYDNSNQKALSQVKNVSEQIEESLRNEGFISDNIKIKQIRQSSNGIRLIQTISGIEIYQSDLNAGFNKHNQISSISGQLHYINDIDVEYKITVKEAVEIAQNHLTRKLNQSDLQFNSTSKEVIYANGFIYTPSYLLQMTVNSFEVWKLIVSGNGSVLQSTSLMCSITEHDADHIDLNGVSHNLRTIEDDGTFLMADNSKPMYNELSNTGWLFVQSLNEEEKAETLTAVNNTSWSPSAVSAQYNASQSYDYYESTFGRISYDDNSSDIRSIIDFKQDDEDVDNAFWTGTSVTYGNGRFLFKPLAGGLDVGGHELTHGVIQTTADLNYEFESGAVNESFADIFGAMIDRDNWQIGEDIVQPRFYPTGAMRDMSNPHQDLTRPWSRGWQPNHVHEKYFGYGDAGGVHRNSGIPNHAFYLIAENISKEKAEQIFYRALTVYLTPTSNFIDLRIACEESTKDLIDTGIASLTFTNNDLLEVQNGFDAVGIVQKGEEDNTVELERDFGDELFLYTDINTKGISMINFTEEKIRDLSLAEAISKPSISNDGKRVIFVDSNNKIRLIELTWFFGNITESVINADTEWANAAISKDGKRIAAVPLANSPILHIYDIESETWKGSIEISPTSDDSEESPVSPIRANSLAWDFDGERVLVETEFTDHSFLYFVNVWNQSGSNLGTGQTTVAIDGFLEGTSLLNPSYAIRSPHIFTFDQVNPYLGIEGDTVTLGYNMITKEIGVLFDTDQYDADELAFQDLGDAAYSLDDSQLYCTVKDFKTDEIKIAIATLNTNKLYGNRSTFSTLSLTDAKWPILFNIEGSQDQTQVADVDVQVESLVNVYPNPSRELINVSGINGQTQFKFYNKLGILSLQGILSPNHQIDIKSLSPGVYILVLNNGEEITRRQIIKI
ncbi:M4 family metallopeptidase [Reichenbachiella versicolor]|uniref:M4 family metallopeptidase n=1 Tax=Reichenbachiella versicolor TaxID=1821036 RepID=UPI000D6DE28E|nr:M4 family metallopeptidase [Reichenbachiella versicolor]